MKTKSVDPTENPANARNYIKYLENCQTRDFFLQIEQLTYDLLNIKKGDNLIDIGCGKGDDVRAMAKYVGKNGKVIGLCNENDIIVEANKLSEGLQLPIEFIVCDAHMLPYPDNSFDGCRAVRVLEHLENPQKALAEMIRIARPGARIVAAEPDPDTYTIDSTCDPSISPRITHAHADNVRKNTMGSQLYRLFKSAHLENIEIIPQVIVVTNYSLFKGAFFELETELDTFVKANIITIAEKSEWLASLEEMQRKGLFFASGTIFVVSGSKA